MPLYFEKVLTGFDSSSVICHCAQLLLIDFHLELRQYLVMCFAPYAACLPQPKLIHPYY